MCIRAAPPSTHLKCQIQTLSISTHLMFVCFLCHRLGSAAEQAVENPPSLLHFSEWLTLLRVRFFAYQSSLAPEGALIVLSLTAAALKCIFFKSAEHALSGLV